MLACLLFGGLLLSMSLSVYAWKGRPSWPLQLVAAGISLAISYPLIFGGLGFITAALGIGQFVLAILIYCQGRRTPDRA